MTEVNQRIKTKRETSVRRAEMSVKCFELKIQSNKLSKTQLEKLSLFFKQAKYLANAVIGSDDIFKFDYKTKSVEVKWKENDKVMSEIKELLLPSQIKQLIRNNIITDIINLNKAKKKGLKVGKLRFRKEVNCIGLVQYNYTWKFGEKNHIHIAGIGWVKINGKDQIIDEIKEFGPAKLIRKPDGYTIQVTCFKPKETKNAGQIEVKDIIGLDFGIKDNITLSTGEKFNFETQIPKSLKRTQRNHSRKKKGSKNRFKLQRKLKKQYQKINNKKTDKSNKFVSNLKNKYKMIFIQDENIKGWHSGLFGKQVQESCLGRIKSKLMKLSTTVISRYEPTTKLCPLCGYLNTLTLAQREYKCGCGFSEDRDTKSAKTCAIIGLTKYILAERKDFKPVEILTSTSTEKYNILFGMSKLKSAKQEAQSL